MNDSTGFITVNGRFHGPPDSGNGGYTCGLVGKLFDGPAVVRLRISPPLDTPMEVRKSETGVEVFHQGDLVVSGRSAMINIDIPDPPDFEGAQQASRRYRGFHSHFYPGCFVCGPERDHGDGLRVFAGPVESPGAPDGMVAAAWIPDESLRGPSGYVATEFLWAVLDCPGAYAFPEPASSDLLLGELTVSINGTVQVGEKCVLTAWEISHEGRKHFTGTALFGESGVLLAVGYATWFEVSKTRANES